MQIDPSAGVMGVVLAVAVAGHEALYGTSPSVYALPQRIQDCLGALSSTSTVQARPAALRLLHAYLLSSSPDERATNEMVAQTISFPAAQEMRGVLSPMMMAARHHRQQDHQPPPFLVWDVTASEPPCSAVTARNLLDQMTVLSVAQDDAAFAAYQRSAQERKAQLDVGGRFRRRKADDADLEGMEYKGPVKADSASTTSSIAAPRKLHAPPATEKLRSSKKDTKVSTRSDTASTTSSSFDPFRSSTNGRSAAAPIAPSRLMSSSDPTTQRSSRQLQINFALNEDLACSYKLSQLASCSVEGVVQVRTILY